MAKLELASCSSTVKIWRSKIHCLGRDKISRVPATLLTSELWMTPGMSWQKTSKGVLLNTDMWHAYLMSHKLKEAQTVWGGRDCPNQWKGHPGNVFEPRRTLLDTHHQWNWDVIQACHRQVQVSCRRTQWATQDNECMLGLQCVILKCCIHLHSSLQTCQAVVWMHPTPCTHKAPYWSMLLLWPDTDS